MHKRIIAAAALVFVAYTCVAVLLTWPLAAAPDRYYFSPEVPGDGIGIIAESWYSDYARQTGMKGYTTKFYGYPFGVDRRGVPVYPLDTGLRNQLTQIIGPQAASSVLILLSFPLAGFFAFILLYYLTRSYAASFVAGFLYAFSPWHTARAFDQLSLTGIYTLPLFLLALIFFWKRRDAVSALCLALTWIIAFYTDFHFGLFCALILVTWSTVAAFYWWRDKTGRQQVACGSKAGLQRTLLLMGLAILLTIAATAPFINDALYRDPEMFPGSGRGGVKEAEGFSANAWNYVVPPSHALLWRWFTDDFVGDRLGLRTSNEVTAYPGILTVALALAALALALKKKYPEDMGTDAARQFRLMIAFGVLLVCVAFVLSFSPQYTVGGVKIPTPSILVSFLVPMFRYFARWAIVVSFGLCLLAGIGFYLLYRSRRWGRAAIWCGCFVVIAFFALDVTIIPPLRSKDISRPPETIRRLASYPKDESVAIYPLAQGSEYTTLYYRYLQQFHLHPMLNGTKQATESDLYRLSLKDIYSEYTPRMLKGLGIDKVVVLDELFANKDYGNYPFGVPFAPGRMPEGYRLAEETSDGYIYDVVAEPASVYPLYNVNFAPPSMLEDGTSWAAMLKPRAEVLLANRGSKGLYSITYTFSNPGPAGQLTFNLDGREVGSVTLNSGTTRITVPGLELSGGKHVLGLDWNGKPQIVDGTSFRAGKRILVYLLLSEPTVQQE